jgi:hypothetical protein
MRTFLTTLAAFGLACSITACKGSGTGGDGGTPAQPIPEDELPEAAAAVLCELFVQCSCDDSEGELACVEDRRATTNEQQLAAQDAGLLYDDQCAGDLLALSESSGCAPQFQLDCDTFCSVYHGEQGVGDPCTIPVADQPTWSDCAQGLWCIVGTCADPCGSNQVGLGLGEMCRDEEGQSLGACDSQQGLWCDFQSRTCMALPGVGEPCFGGEVCGPGAVCDWSGNEAVCVPVPKLGEACTYVCDAGLYCNGIDGGEGTCAALPGEGQTCAGGSLCAADHVCNTDNLCEPLPGWICSI